MNYIIIPARVGRCTVKTKKVLLKYKEISNTTLRSGIFLRTQDKLYFKT